MKVFDLHSDLFTDIAWRKSRGEKNIFDRIHYPVLKKGGVTAVLCVFWVEPAFRRLPYERFKELYAYVMNDLHESKHAYIHDPFFQKDTPPGHEQIHIYLGLEGLTFMEGWEGDTAMSRIDNAFQSLAESKINHAIFVWNERNFLATGTGVSHRQKKEGLTDYGRMAVQKANQQNWLLDVSHLNEASFWDMYHASALPVMASHSNAKSLCDHERNLTNQQIKAIARKGGIIGLNAYGGFVSREKPNIDQFINHAVYIADLVGIEHLAFGFDFLDYLEPYKIGTGITAYTEGLEDVSKVPSLLEKMSKRGFAAAELEAISFYNAERFIKRHIGNKGESY